MRLEAFMPCRIALTDGFLFRVMTLHSMDFREISVRRICSKTVCITLLGEHGTLLFPLSLEVAASAPQSEGVNSPTVVG